MKSVFAIANIAWGFAFNKTLFGKERLKIVKKNTHLNQEKL